MRLRVAVLALRVGSVKSYSFEIDDILQILVLISSIYMEVVVIKSELVQIIANRNPHLFQRDVENIVSAVFETISTALAEGSRVELRGFGAFSVKNRPARAGRNPRTGESVSVEEKWVPFFKTGKELRDRLNNR